MAKIKTEDLPVDETLSEEEARQVRGGFLSSFNSIFSSLRAASKAVAKVAGGTTITPAEPEQTTNAQAQLAAQMQRTNQAYQTLAGINQEMHNANKEIIKNVGG